LVDVRNIEVAPGYCVKVLVDQLDGFTNGNFVHVLLPLLSHEHARPGDMSPVPLAKETLAEISRRRYDYYR
jgi:hypothetical protein